MAVAETVEVSADVLTASSVTAHTCVLVRYTYLRTWWFRD